ncbi:hypothetical protein CJD36_008965 [Flavipsychrobacter stenotrophus]|uniref:Uncharacterized protein n=1 Tax=Flavipsychrobacter stenotrophus TaxID=2077091 RepID=A0A2S7SY91_9BACT|nr:hypothetical protein [Flavipsychrobacter stenotrophus]PQJ11913.1 hypothetical protein CJD36_008965 [Flavipsychrobacter stenotrophus]
MRLANRFNYRDLFEESRPQVKDLLIGISSQYIIVMLSLVNNILLQLKETNRTQLEIFSLMTSKLPEAYKAALLGKVENKLMSGDYALFSFQCTVEFINREIINYREGNLPLPIDLPEIELKILKAYVVITEEIGESDSLDFDSILAEAKRSPEGVLKLMWPHLIEQSEFVNRADIAYELYKGIALVSYLEKHEKYAGATQKHFEALNCTSGRQYINFLQFLIFKNLPSEELPHPRFYNFIVKVEGVHPFWESLVLDPKEISENENKQIGYKGLKEKPVFKFSNDEYVIPYWDFFYNALFTGLIFSIYNNSGIKKIENFMDFRSTVGTEFTENILFRNLMKSCFSRKHEFLAFFDDPKSIFSPDCYYRRGNNIFIIEFKDNMLSNAVIQSKSYEEIRKALYSKFVETKNKNKSPKKVFRN